MKMGRTALSSLSVVLMLCLTEIRCDMYFHNPRGSNDRLNENGRARKNANRMFDSQNNNRGGYNVGPEPMYYYSGSKLQIEWTNQHSCSDENNFCEVILQYMCHSNLRDGTTTTTIPLKHNGCANNNCDTDQKYGMHENNTYYHNCRLRERNKGLFTADQNMKNRDTAVSTRQDNNGKNNRYAYECPEERDYYPYWQPSPWRDIAIMTNDPKRCNYYKTESANVKSRWACYFPPDVIQQMIDNVKSIPNNQADCETFKYPNNDKGVKGVWKEIPSHGIPAPECRYAQYSRDNHLGNGIDGQPNRYNWTVPDLNQNNCALRIRYNISTNDFDGWRLNSSANADNPNNPTKLDLSAKYGFANYEQAKERGYVYEGDPEMDIFGVGDFNFKLAVDTSQFARTFQDRSHRFSIKKRPANLEGAVIHNLNVRGKRGNIVQVYPAVEYDFVPNTLEMKAGQYIHFQWTGSDTNPNNNDGQGKKGSDRNNVLLLSQQRYPEGTGRQYGPPPKYGQYGNNYPAHLNNSSFLGLSLADRKKLAFLDPENADANLNDVSPYFDLGPRQVNQLGTYQYVSTRNNDFSNRDQKGRIMVTNMEFTDSVLDSLGGDVALPNGVGTVHAEPGALTSLERMRMEVWPKVVGDQKIQAAGSMVTQGNDYASDFLVIYPETVITAPGKKLTISLKLTDPDGSNIDVYRASSENNYALWTKMDTSIEGGMAKFQASSGGVYVARTHSYTVLIVSLMIAIIVVALLVGGAIIYFKRNPAKWEKLKNDTAKLPINFKSKV